jgi:hypothetical protein
MLNPGRLKSAFQGALWLVRGAGIRRNLRELDERLAALDAKVARASGLDQRLTQCPEWRSTAHLRAFERRAYSQFGEDGIIEEIFRRVGYRNKYFVEFGVESGIECNAARLALVEKWSGLFLEADPVCFEQLKKRYEPFPAVRCVQAFVSSANIENLLEANAVPTELDLLSIDIDGNDYWVWKAIFRWKPRVVVIEYNASRPPQERWVMAENPNHRWDGTDYFGASLRSLTELAREKGYTLVGTNSHGINAFFVRDDLACDNRFVDPTVYFHYSPPGYGAVNGGHPPGSGPAVVI